jgi:hypothetical protein
MPAAARLCLPDIPVAAVRPRPGVVGPDVRTQGERLLSRAHETGVAGPWSPPSVTLVGTLVAPGGRAGTTSP